MSLKLQVIHASEFIKMTQKGEVDLTASKRALAEIARAASGVEDCQFLVDVREAVSRLSTFDIWEIAAELEKYDVFVRRKIAMLVSRTGERTEFFKLCTQNRGYWVNYFQDYEEAINWLFLPTEVSPEGPKEQVHR